jgi:DNA polymerase III alpha subunit
MYGPISIRSEYSFHNSFAKISDIVALDYDTIGIADDNTTFGFIPFAKAMKSAGKKPLFGVRLEVFEDMTERFSKRFQIILIAKNDVGLKEIYRIVSKAWDNFFWVPRLSFDDYEAITTDIWIVDTDNTFIDNNNYLTVPDRDVYQLIAGSSKRGDERNYNFNTELKPQHVLSENEIRAYYGQAFIDNAIEVAQSCNANISHAQMVKFEGKQSIDQICNLSKKWYAILPKDYNSFMNCN